MTSTDPRDHNDDLLKSRLRWPSLAAMGFTSMMGSGWLLASHYAAQVAGPLAVVSWLIAGAATIMVGLIYSHLAVAWPLAGGNVRWPRLTSGSFVGAIVGWAAFIQISVATPGEATAILQYASQWLGGVFDGGRLTPLGLGVAVGMMVLCVGLNFLGVVTLARLNNVLVVFKIVVPIVIIVMLVGSGFDSANVEVGGGLAPNGLGAALTAVTSAGLLFSFAGVMTPAVMSGEARNPRKDVPVGTMLAVGGVLACYLGLQIAYIAGLPSDMLAETGWSGVNLNSPFAQLAVFLNLHWLSTLVLVDSAVAPGGTLFTSTGWKGRVTFGLGQERLLPAMVGRVHSRSGIPQRALVLNLAVSTTFLLVFQSWHQLASIAGYFLAVVYAGASIAAGTIDMHPGRTDARPWLRHARAFGALSFIFSALLIYWAGWQKSRDGILILACLLVIYLLVTRSTRLRQAWDEIREGMWFATMLVVVAAVGYVGSYGGRDLVPEPFGSILVVIVGFVTYACGVRKARQRIHSGNAVAVMA